MVKHIVLFSWALGTSDAQLEQVLTELRKLKHCIPGILDLNCGENFSGRAHGFTHGLVITFINRVALNGYESHPAHQYIVTKFIDPIKKNILAFDFEEQEQI